jgi:hypothetical protein
VALDNKNVSEKGFLALSRMKHLRVFLFADFDRMKRKPDTELTQVLLCMQLMPRLQLVGREFDLSECVNLMGRHLFCYHDSLQQLRHPMRLDLHELVLSGECGRLSKNIQLPEVRRLHLYMPSADDLRPLLRKLSQVTELGLWKVSGEVLSQILAQLGARLDKLYVLGTDPVQLGRVFECCPRLSELRIVQTDVASGCTPMPPSSSFARLRLLEITQESGKYGVMPRGFLTHVLSAPLLENVRLASFWLTSDDIRQMQQLLMERAILQRLERFECETNNDEMSETLKDYVLAHCPLAKEPDIMMLLPSYPRFDSTMIKTMRKLGFF